MTQDLPACHGQLADLKTIFGKAVRDKLVEANALGQRRVRMLKKPDSPDRILSPSEEAAVLEQLVPVDRLAVTIAFHTGLRISEQVERQRKDLNLDRGRLYIPDAKGGGRQEVRLDGVALKAFKQLWTSHDSPWLFPSVTGTGHINRGVVAGRFVRALERAQIEGVTLHTLRHTYIFRLVMLEIPVVTVQHLACINSSK